MGAIIAGCSVVGGPAGVVGYLLALTGAGLLVVLARRAYGGTTGDVLGAVEQVGEMAVLSAAARLVAEHGWQWG
jgi:adenosylcobinamide-GDP ribazoletransferase